MRQILTNTLSALLTGSLLMLSFPHPDLGFLVFFALVPLLVVIYKSSLLRSFLYGWLAGMVFFAGISYWFAIYGALPYILIVVGMGFFIALFSLGSSFVISRAGFLLRLLFIPSFWVALEFLRSELGSWSYPYGVLGYSQHNYLPVIQIASLLGVYGISSLIVLVNVGILELGLSFSTRSLRSLARRILKNIVRASEASRERRILFERSRELFSIAIVFFVLALSIAYGLVRLNTFKDAGEKIRLAVIQVSIPESLERLPDEEEAMGKYERAVRRAAKTRPDLIVMPESTLPNYVTEDDPLFLQVKEWAQEVDTPLLVGVPLISEDGKAFNTAQLFSTRGKVLGKYAKIYPVPFGEFVPIRAVTERVYEKTAMLGDITAGDKPAVFRLPGRQLQSKEARTFSVLMCSESSYSSLARRMVGRGANLLFVLTNDAWFLKSAEADQHFAMSKFRAVENGRYLAQSANSGISGFITPTGQVLRKSKLFEVTTLKGEVSFEDTKTFYTRFGFLFPYLTLFITLTVIARSPSLAFRTGSATKQSPFALSK